MKHLLSIEALGGAEIEALIDSGIRLKAERGQAFAAPEASYRPLTAAEVIARNRT